MKLHSTCPSKRILPTAQEEENGKKIVYWSCPVKYIPESIFYWYQMYDYEITFPGCIVPAFQDRKRRYLKALSYYRSKKMEYQVIFRERQVEKMKNQGRPNGNT